MYTEAALTEILDYAERLDMLWMEKYDELKRTLAPLNNKRVEQTFKFLREVCDLPDSSASDEYIADRFIKAYTNEEWNDQ